MRYEVTTYIPERLNDGTPIPDDQLLELFWRVADFGGGANIDRGVTGLYRMRSGQRQDEPVARLTVVMEESDVPAARAVVHEIGRELGQEQMFFRAVPAEGTEIFDVA